MDKMFASVEIKEEHILTGSIKAETKDPLDSENVIQETSESITETKSSRPKISKCEGDKAVVLPVRNDIKSQIDETIIKCVKENQHLYDKRSRFYKDERRKENTWISIAHSINTDPETAKRRWENLRDRFVRAYREISEESPNGSGAKSKTTTFPYYEMMKWLKPYIRKRKMTCIRLGLKPAVEPCSEYFTPTLSLEVGDGVYTINEAGALIPVEEETPSTSQITNGRTRGVHESHPSGSSEPRAKRVAIHDTVSKAVNTQSSLTEKRVIAPNTSGDINFMKSVIEDMKLIPAEKRISFKREVMQLLEKYICEENIQS